MRLPPILGCLVLLVLAGIANAQVNIGFGGVAYDADEPIEATSDTLTIDQTTGEALFTGDVVVIQGELRLAAPRVRVIYVEVDGRREIDEVIATGGVLITRGIDAAEGNEAYFDASSSFLTMVGDVLVTQRDSVVSGDRMVVNLQTGNGTVEGRVRTFLTPEPDDGP